MHPDMVPDLLWKHGNLYNSKSESNTKRGMTDNPSDVEIPTKRGRLAINHDKQLSINLLEVKKRVRLHQAQFKHR